MQKILNRIKDSVNQSNQTQHGATNPAAPSQSANLLPRPQPPGPVEYVSEPGPVASIQPLGEVLSTNAELIRDLGFSGRIGDTWINSYGDVLICGDGSREDREKQRNPWILASNCAAWGTEDPTRVVDFNLAPGRRAQMFCPLFPEELPACDYAVGITNVIPTSETTGVVYFLKNYRQGGINRMVGAGVAVVDITGKFPTARRLGEYWWDAKKEPWYGDHSAVIGQDNWTYVYGGVNEDKGNPRFYDGLFLCRVPHGSETELSKYQYWNGSAFTPERISPSEQTAVLAPGSTGGMVTWNPYLQKYLYIYTTFNVIIGRTAERPEGPWSPHFKIKAVADRAFVYCPSQQYRYDPSGKTLVISYTAHPNQIFALRIEEPSDSCRSAEFQMRSEVLGFEYGQTAPSCSSTSGMITVDAEGKGDRQYKLADLLGSKQKCRVCMARCIALAAKSRLLITPLLDVSREVHIGGNWMSIALNSSCVSNMNVCVFKCNSCNPFGDSETYNLVSCAAARPPDASYDVYGGNPSGSCHGFSYRGYISVYFTNQSIDWICRLIY